MTDDDANRRIAQRHRVLKGALIVFNSGGSTINCTVRNLSATGARLSVTSILGIPDHFVLELNDKTGNYPCEVVWRRETELGVRFVAPDAG